MVLTTLSAATSITETSFDIPLVVSKYFWSGVNAKCQTRWPTSRYFLTSWVTPSITATRLAGPSATNAVAPSLVMAMPTGWMASARNPGMAKLILLVTRCLTGSMMLTAPPTSEETHSSEAFCLNTAKRGRDPTSTLATISWLAASMKCAMLVVSEVLMRILPSGLTAMPSGSTPTSTSPTRARFSMSRMVTVLSFSLATYKNLPVGSWLNNSGSGPDGSVPVISSVLVSIIWMVSSSPQATSTNLPSLVTSMPRGRWPTLIVFTASNRSVSMTVTVLAFSFDT